MVLGRTEEALDLLHRAVDLSREIGFRYAEGAALNNLGEAFLDLDSPEEAIGYLTQARRIFDEIKLPTGTGYALHNLGRPLSSWGVTPRALGCLQQAVVVHRGTGDRRREAFALRYLGQRARPRRARGRR